MTDDELHDLAPLHALDALDDVERRRFERHLATCDRCTATVAELRATAAELADAVAVEPPPALRARVLAEVAGTPQVPGGAATTGAPGGAAGAGRRPSAEHARWRPAAALAAAAAVLALVLGGGWVVTDLADERDRAQELAAVLAAPDARTATLEGEPGATLRVVWSPEADAAVVVGAGLADPGEGRVYELWALAPDGPRSAGLFEPGDDGIVRRRLDLPAEPAGGWGVTIEPAGGSPQPTGDILFVGTA